MKGCRSSLVAATVILLGSSAFGSSYYRVTDLGNAVDFQVPELSLGQSSDPNYLLTNRSTGVSYALTKESTNVGALGELPGHWGEQGVSFPRREYWQLSMRMSNEHGLVVGDMPNGGRSIPWSSTYQVSGLLGEDGKYHWGDNLSNWFMDGLYISGLDINAKNQILVYEDATGRSSTYRNPEDSVPYNWLPRGGLFDTETKTKTDLNAILPPDVLLMTMGGLHLLDDGSILGQADLGDGIVHQVLLTPPGQPLPEPVPEPTALATLILGASAFFGVRTLRRRSGRPRVAG